MSSHSRRWRGDVPPVRTNENTAGSQTETIDAALSLFLDDIPTYRFFPSAYYYLGRAQEGLNSPAAAESFRTFLAIKSKTDADPLVEYARKHLSAR